MFQCYSLFMLPSSSTMFTSWFTVCISIVALQIISSIPSFYVWNICANIWYLFFSFWFTSFCVIGTRFICLIITDSNTFIFMSEHQAEMAQERPRGATPCPRSGVAAERSNPTSKEWWLHGCRRAERSYSMFKVWKGDLVQGKEQWLQFSGAAVKRYLTSKVRETQVRR